MTNSAVLGTLGSTVSCVGCRRSVETLYTTLTHQVSNHTCVLCLTFVVPLDSAVVQSSTYTKMMFFSVTQLWSP